MIGAKDSASGCAYLSGVFDRQAEGLSGKFDRRLRTRTGVNCITPL